MYPFSVTTQNCSLTSSVSASYLVQSLTELRHKREVTLQYKYKERHLWYRPRAHQKYIGTSAMVTFKFSFIQIKGPKETCFNTSYQSIQIQFGVEDPSFAGVHHDVCCLPLPLGLRLCGVSGDESCPLFPDFLFGCKGLELFVNSFCGNAGGFGIGASCRCCRTLCLPQDAYGVSIQCIELYPTMSKNLIF